MQPRVLLLDEPLSNLDAKLRLRLRGELRKLQRKLGITMIYVTHDQEEAMSLADRIAVMRNGIVEEVGSPEQLYSNPSKLFTAMFLGRTTLVLGKVVDTEDETAVIQLGEIQVKAINHGLGKGDTAALVVKAEGATTRQPHGPSDYTVLRGTVSVSMYIGSFIEVRLAIPGLEKDILLDLPNDEKEPPIGSELEVYVPLRNMHAYPAEEEIVKEALEQA